MLIDLFIVLKGKMAITVKRKEIIPREEGEEEEPEVYFLPNNGFICWDNIWQYIENYDKNARIRHLQPIEEDGELEIWTLKMSDYKQIIKKTHHERTIVKFMSKAIPTLDSYCLSTKMKVLNNFIPKYYKAGEFICKEGQKPDNPNHIVNIIRNVLQ